MHNDLQCKSMHNDLQCINKSLRCITIQMIIFTIVLSAFIIGATWNAYKQFKDFNEELDQKYAHIEQQFDRINDRYEQSKNY